ncbi:hypothetical protein AB0A63_24515 [Lentzea sp. NPDC042327]|uniref:hypothetical protein n=1 Tax=Lentzea sp. NPDC042327 TaxID=3154801 RepID=UPI0033C5348A
MNGFSVDLGELDAAGRQFRGLADDVRGHVAWKFGVDTERWPDDDPLRAAVDVYQRSLIAARDRLCARTDRVAALLQETADNYRRLDDVVAQRLSSVRAGDALDRGNSGLV